MQGTEGCPTDGIQADHSFHQHGPELLDGSYGEGYVKDTLTFMTLSRATSFAPNQEQSELFTSLLLDGMRWMTVGSPAKWDWSVKGRDMGSVARKVLFDTSAFSAISTTRAAELATFGAAIDGKAAEMLEGHRAYWTSDYAVIHSQNVAASGGAGIPWMASVHMHSNR